ncbi:MAG: hypothetical protein ACOX19_08610 [Fermentimonas sp.]
MLPKVLHRCYRKRCTIVTESAALVFTENAVFSVSVYNACFIPTRRRDCVSKEAYYTLLLLGGVSINRKAHSRKLPKLDHEQVKFDWEEE